mmetsp:Transcript_6391/g.19983  ORF Transcript_6391/g.19983 Transcript_6391/m.19983 type:complete len:277 (+) Transcript_6391:206-1036(+)
MAVTGLGPLWAWNGICLRRGRAVAMARRFQRVTVRSGKAPALLLCASLGASSQLVCVGWSVLATVVVVVGDSVSVVVGGEVLRSLLFDEEEQAVVVVAAAALVCSFLGVNAVRPMTIRKKSASRMRPPLVRSKAPKRSWKAVGRRGRPKWVSASSRPFAETPRWSAPAAWRNAFQARCRPWASDVIFTAILPRSSCRARSLETSSGSGGCRSCLGTSLLLVGVVDAKFCWPTVAPELALGFQRPMTTSMNSAMWMAPLRCMRLNRSCVLSGAKGTP